MPTILVIPELQTQEVEVEGDINKLAVTAVLVL
jgi:acid stress-induced BolA-like protein IbaG/YrbA